MLAISIPLAILVVAAVVVLLICCFCPTLCASCAALLCCRSCCGNGRDVDEEKMRPRGEDDRYPSERHRTPEIVVVEHQERQQSGNRGGYRPPSANNVFNEQDELAYEAVSTSTSTSYDYGRRSDKKRARSPPPPPISMPPPPNRGSGGGGNYEAVVYTHVTPSTPQLAAHQTTRTARKISNAASLHSFGGTAERNKAKK